MCVSTPLPEGLFSGECCECMLPGVISLCSLYCVSICGWLYWRHAIVTDLQHITRTVHMYMCDSYYTQGVGFLCDAIKCFQIPEGPEKKNQMDLASRHIGLWWKALLGVVLVQYPEETVEGVNFIKKELKDPDKTTFKQCALKHFSYVVSWRCYKKLCFYVFSFQSLQSGGWK